MLGAKSRPAGFRDLTCVAPSELVDRALSLDEVFGDAGRALERSVVAAADDRARVALVERFVRARHPGLDAEAHDANRIVELARVGAAITRVADLAASAGRTVRAIERIFRAHVGVPPKWVIRRFRVQEAAARLAGGNAVDCTALAHELGYSDQAHFIRDFESQVGRTPAHYAKVCEAE